jgi:hypothetical protein
MLGVMIAGLAVAVAGIVAVVGSRDSSAADVQAVSDQAELDRVGAAALALVRYDPAKVGYRIAFGPGQAGVRAQTDRSSKTIGVFLRRGDLPHVVAHDIAHELGHAYDQANLDADERQAYLSRRGVPTAAWLPDAASDYGVGAGDFAEVFALCHAASPDFRSTLAQRPENPCALLPAGAR